MKKKILLFAIMVFGIMASADAYTVEKHRLEYQGLTYVFTYVELSSAATMEVYDSNGRFVFEKSERSSVSYIKSKEAELEFLIQYQKYIEEILKLLMHQ
jgi:hypothetical protein